MKYSNKKNFTYFDAKVGLMFIPSFVRISDSGLQIIEKLIDLAWNDAYAFTIKFGCSVEIFIVN